MSPAKLVISSLRYYWRSHLGVILGAILGTGILVGALAVGDSVRFSLKSMALARLGEVELSLHVPNRFFGAGLAEELSEELNAPVAAVVMLRGTASAGGGDVRVGNVQVVGVSDPFWRLGGTPSWLAADAEEAVLINERLALRLNVKAGDDILLRVDKPSLLSRDAPLSTVEGFSVALRLPVGKVLSDAEFGRFSLEANQIPPYNAFVPMELLQERIALSGRANALLIGKGAGATLQPADAATALRQRWQLADAGLELRALPGGDTLELRTDRVFIDAPVAQAATENPLLPGAQGVLTYFVNELRANGRTTPYSTVAALGGSIAGFTLAEDETLINQWLADDLQARIGDMLTITYFVMGPTRQLTEQSSAFRIRGILPMQGIAADPELMPEFPGLHDSENCRDWDPGIPVDLQKIRDRDEAYWDAYRGAPKALISLAAGQQLWRNRFGNLTAVRYPTAGQSAATVEACIRQALNPMSIGLFFVPIRQLALDASTQSTDFGMLFLGFSIFLIVAALMLMALLFAFGVEQRAGEVGVLLAVGLLPSRVQRLLLLEGGALALVASLVGAGVGVLYTRIVIRGLSTVWSGAVVGSTLQYHAEPTTLAIGAFSGFLVALFAIWLVVRRQAKSPARELLSASGEGTAAPLATGGRGRLAGLPTTIGAGALAVGMVAMAATSEGEKAAEYFFGAGALLLIAGIAACRVLLSRLERQSAHAHLTVGALGIRNSTRRTARSLTAIGLLASGSFLVIGVFSFYHGPHHGEQKRSSGTGGFALYGEATLPVHGDLNTAEGLEAFALEPEDLPGVRILPMRLREGDEASCLNLNRAQTPRLLGVDPAALGKLQAFTFKTTLDKEGRDDPWGLLDRSFDDGAVPAIGDENTLLWALGQKVGGELDFIDERGQTFKVRIVGSVARSILQGSLLISERNFTERFPSLSGYQVFLIDAPAERVAAASQLLTRSLEDVGLSLTTTSDRLAEFNAVENTYLSIFAVLGGLGLLLGSVGLGVVVLRNVLERRGELALMRAVGFRRKTLQWLVFSEHSLLLALGLAIGVAAALIAVLPALLTPGANVPYATLAITLTAVLASGFLWTWGATLLALRGPLLDALRSE